MNYPQELCSLAERLMWFESAAQVEHMLDPANQTLAQLPAKQKSEVVSRNGSADADENYPEQVKASIFVREKAGEHQDGLARNGYPGIFAKQASQDCPISPVDKRVTNGVIEPVHSAVRSTSR